MSKLPVFLNRLFKAPYHYNSFLGTTIKSDIYRTLFTTCFLSKNISFKLSDIGEGIREVVVKEWFVNVGDKISQFDNICEVQSDKASVTITSRYDGIITKLHYQVDDIALVGKPLVDLETDEGIDENAVIDESVPAKELESSKEHIIQSSSVHAESRSADGSIVTEGFAESIATRNVNFSVENRSTIQTTSLSSSSDENTILCIPSVRRLAKEHQINLSKVNGTGKYGRILKEDVLKYIQEFQSPVSKKIDASLRLEQSDTEIKPITGFSKIMVKTMTEALKIPHFVYSDEIKITKLSKLREEIKALPELDVKVTFLPFFIKAASNALQLYPIINSSVDEKCENIIYRKHHNIGVAMATDQGLAVPVVRNVENLSVLEIAKEINRLMTNGKNGTFSPSDLTGGTFTISNIGIVGGTYTKPVILPPQVAIIAIGKNQILPRFDEAGNIIKENIINISGSADHRIVDGINMANFIKTLKRQIENPNLLFLNL